MQCMASGQSHVSLGGPEPRQLQAHLIPPRNTGTDGVSIYLSRAWCYVMVNKPGATISIMYLLMLHAACCMWS
ncbi:hypothetical protein GBA52_028091 [Prunus armeniaca]|nr:hypothetical protein GBA52_028091 [Prunus armeniaca]